MKKGKRTGLYAAAALIAVGICACFAGGRFLLGDALNGRRSRTQQETLVVFALDEEMNNSQADARVNGWLSVVQQEDVSLDTQRGELSGSVFEPVSQAGDAPWAIVVHGGLGTDRSQVRDIACELSLAGYRVLTPDLYAHGSSAGKIASLGLADAQDVSAWIDWILCRDQDARIVLMGVDEGAAAVLLAAVSNESGAVCAAAADSAYADVRDRAMQMLSETASADGAFRGLSEKLFAAAYRVMFGVSLDEGDLLHAVRETETPMLFLHGTGDMDVPAWHSEDLRREAGEGVRLYLAEGAGHGTARFLDPDGYYDALLSFFAAAI